MRNRQMRGSQDGIAGAFNARMRDELFDDTLFFGIDHARKAIPVWVRVALSVRHSGNADDPGCAERVDAVHQGDADMDFGGLAVGVPCSDALAEGLEAAHPGSSAAARLGSLPSWSTVLADRDDRRATACDDGTVAAPRVVSAICGHGADVFVFGGLIQQIRQDGPVTFPAGGELDRADVGGGGVHGRMHLAPLAAAQHSMLKTRSKLSPPPQINHGKTTATENGGAKLVHGGGGIVSLRAE